MDTNRYRYSIELRYMKDKTECVLDTTNIHYMLIDYDYDNKNMPVIIMKLAIDKNLLDDMIKNSSNKTVTLIIQKYIYDSSPSIKEDYIRKEFIYFLSDNINYTKDLDYSGENTDREDIHRIVEIGLMDQDMINSNKKVINTVVQSGNLSSLLLMYLGDSRILMEPVNNININNFIVPPLNSKTQFIRYIDNCFNLYNSRYRLFYDFDKTYLLGSTGNAIPSKEEKATSIFINVDNTAVPESKTQGMYIDYKKRAYILEVDTQNIAIAEDKATHRSVTKIIGVGSDGNTSEADIANSKNNKSTNIEIRRMINNNTDNVSNIKSDIDNYSTMVSITKTELDSSIFTINKEYTINNYDQLKDKTGRFLLSRKREIYTRDDHNYILTSILSLRKVIS